MSKEEHVKGILKNCNGLAVRHVVALEEEIERLEKALIQIAGISDTNPYRESELMRIVAKDALEETE